MRTWMVVVMLLAGCPEAGVAIGEDAGPDAEPCGIIGEACCPEDPACWEGLCHGPAGCVACGGEAQPCCPACDEGLACDGALHLCGRLAP